MLEGKAVIGSTDMPEKMQARAMEWASEALDLYEVDDCKEIARHIKKGFDGLYGPGWQCIVGTSFGSFITHSCGTFIHFYLERMAFLLFKG
ncbi:hypothetical protein SELMODRAFT_227337 [Selaginella moellendorffii]|uniref:Dynein light chain n=1 Tax=Selaginella moellendorffii TaxID=88036 RepID=D8QV98_SELML|nr:probable dynein light chain [Selaginella moellendorffii]XP_002992789.1 probable dynein light chain [Selaginella moellendorffii]EFJ06175.1 hypothetical protein SELMODRAFT_272292 [Selaginella moellendorffii]EFJ36423.1 hypothetical protein SELMODRAFT_227337 [Selaginella moellendorffii]|eukprot:XP_002962960.1 probable dynein light chain [Selaginella moellendorffii]